ALRVRRASACSPRLPYTPLFRPPSAPARRSRQGPPLPSKMKPPEGMAACTPTTCHGGGAIPAPVVCQARPSPTRGKTQVSRGSWRACASSRRASTRVRARRSSPCPFERTKSLCGASRARGPHPLLYLGFEKFPVEASQSHQLRVGPFLHHPAPVDDQDPVGVDHGGEPVGHHHAGPALHEAFQGLLDQPLRGGVQGGGGLIEEEHPGI